MIDIIFLGIFPSLFLYFVEIGQIMFIVLIIVFSVAIIVKIKKIADQGNIHYKFQKIILIFSIF